MRYRNIFLLSAMTLVVFLFSGCNLVVDDEDHLPGDEFWTGPKENAEAFCLSIYNNLREATIMESGLFFVSGDLRCAPITNLKTNDWMYMVTQNDMSGAKSKLDNGNWGVNNSTRWNFAAIYDWANFYKVIQGANILIREVDGMNSLSAEEKQGYKAEGVFLRNLTYFFLVRLFGDVPYYTDAYNATPLPRTPMLTVLHNCLNDMQTVLDADPNAIALPWSNVPKRASRGSMLALMMHINMWLAQFDKVNKSTYYQEVVRLAETNSWVTGDDYYHLVPIEQTATLFKGGSSESIFDIVQNIPSGEIFPARNMWSYYVVYEIFKRENPSCEYDVEFLQKLYPAEETDQRKIYWFNNMEYDEDGNIITEKAVEESTTLKQVHVEIVKELNEDASSSQLIVNSGNYIVFRLADMILLYAEALNNIGEIEKSLQQLNRIRNRAGATLVESASNLDDAIYWERVRELMGEGQYFYDLVRTGKLCEMEYTLFGESGYRETKANFYQKSWTWPIANNSLINNPNVSKNNYWE